MNQHLYALGDIESLRGRGAFRIQDEAEAVYWNKKGYGIFWTVNEFSGDRKKENLTKINSWAIDIDGGDKQEHIARMKKFIRPSLVVETKNGFHVYWHAKNAKLSNYESIVLDRLVHFFNADEKARDVARILRVPGYLHQKNPKEPFEIKSVWSYPVAYSEDQMFYNFKLKKEALKTSEVKQELRNVFRKDGDDVWEKIYNMDCKIALERISGTAAMGCERVTFRRVSNGNENIVVDGKATSCWIDREGRIGSLSKGGPTIWQWVKWYHRDNKRTYEFIKEYFGEIWTKV
jgi:hypothetical protein